MPAPDDLPPPEASAGQIRDAADEILARREFRQPPKSIYERILEWVDETLNDVLSALFSGGRTSIAAWIALVLVVLVIVLLIVRVARSMRSEPAPPHGVRVVSERRRPPADWEREAQVHAANGEWREALRCRYRALIARLAATGAVDEVPGRTAGEYRLDVRRSRPDAAPPFGSATELFERAWYGHRQTGPGEDEHFRALADEVVNESSR